MKRLDLRTHNRTSYLQRTGPICTTRPDPRETFREGRSPQILRFKEESSEVLNDLTGLGVESITTTEFLRTSEDWCNKR